MADIFYFAVPADWRREQKYRFLEDKESIANIEWQKLQPDKNHNWLTEGMSDDFVSFLPIGSKEGQAETIFTLFSNGVKTNRDAWAWNFDSQALASNVNLTIDTFNEHLALWDRRKDRKQAVDDFVTYDGRLSWSESLKNRLKRGREIEFSESAVRRAYYRPFVEQQVYFDSTLAERRYQLPLIFPTPETESENRVICLSDAGSRSPFGTLLVNRIPEMHFLASSDGFQCFPFYTYGEDGSGRRENVTDWALAQFRARYQSAIGNPQSEITKWDVFHYVYAVLHHPEYRARYAANLRRELPRIPFVGEVGRVTPCAPPSDSQAAARRGLTRPTNDSPVFHAFAAAGKRLAELHVGYEQQPEFPLHRRENPNAPLNWRVEKVKLVKPGVSPSPGLRAPSPPPGERAGMKGRSETDTFAIRYNDFLTLEGIPPEAFEYRLGNRSALEWVIDQYQVSTDPRSGITNDPNRPDDPEYIVRLIAQVITVSLETVKVVKGLPALGM